MIDAHFHCFERSLKIADGARYLPQYDALLSDLQTHWQAHGITRGVIIQPSFLGTDNSYLLQICEHSAQDVRGIAVVSPEISPHALAQMHEQGVRGIRFNWIGLEKWPEMQTSIWAHIRRSMQALGWHVQLHVEGHRLDEAARCFDNWKVPLVIDHLGRPSSISIHDHAQTLQSIVQRRPTYIKVSAPYRCSADTPGSFETVTAALHESVGAKHLLWGSDWPFTQHESSQSYDAVIAEYKRVCADSTVRGTMTRNAEALYFS
ncbi:amidohydrolase family protein [Variovorax sp. PCZ-1]|uniref:amidohydrolase family protein n=1 Tax=Variovorax sp. PCZ-1 TaxID=2835533 RepID=UPI001BCFFF8A|nr:amidohydrolase family protein [Variovorax sp. PCZ-1]